MKALNNKIYVHIGPHLGLMQATSIPVTAPGEQEYIRKTALLEWLDKRSIQIGERFQSCIGEDEAKEVGARLEAYEEIIAKIKSL